MPIFIATLLGGLLNIAGSLVGRILLGLGISAITFSGVGVTLDWLRDNAVQYLTSMPPEVLGIMALMKVGTAINIIFSAIVVRMTLNGFTNGTVRRWVGM